MLKNHAVSFTLPVYADLRYWGVLVLSGCLFKSNNRTNWMLKNHAVSFTLPVYADLRYWGVLVNSGCLFKSNNRTTGRVGLGRGPYVAEQE